MSGEPAPVHRLHPVRVLVFGRDSAFLRVATLLLERRGYAVHATASLGGLRTLAMRFGSQVVVVDGGDSAATAARAAASLEALPVPIPVVALYEGEEAGPLEPVRLLPKWGEFDALVAEIERFLDG